MACWISGGASCNMAPTQCMLVLLLLPRPTTSASFTSDGSCTVSGDCISSPNFPQPYSNSQQRTITANMPGKLSVTDFQTERNFDYLSINDVGYSGSGIEYSPDGVRVETSTSIRWATDASGLNNGWNMCLEADCQNEASHLLLHNLKLQSHHIFLYFFLLQRVFHIYLEHPIYVLKNCFEEIFF